VFVGSVLVVVPGLPGLLWRAGCAPTVCPCACSTAPPAPRHLARAGLAARGAEVLDRLGALGDLPSRSLPIDQVVVHVGGRELARLVVGKPTRLVRRPGLLVSQAEIEERLRLRLGELGGSVEWGRESRRSRRPAAASQQRSRMARL